MERKNIFIITILFLTLILLSYIFFIKESKYMRNFSKTTLGSELRREMIKKNTWSTNCPVHLDRLMLLKVSYVDFEGNEHHDGELIVFDVLADHVLAIFHELYLKKFPMASLSLMNKYEGNDEKSMKDNNSSAFNCRNIKDSNLYSIHAYGMAIDINPQQNPYLVTEYDFGKTTIPVYPPQGMEYINRRNIRAGMVETVIYNDSKNMVVDLFKQHGFSIWGGEWNFPVDWQHFQLTRKQAEELSKLPYEQGLVFFNALTTKKPYSKKEEKEPTTNEQY